MVIIDDSDSEEEQKGDTRRPSASPGNQPEGRATPKLPNPASVSRPAAEERNPVAAPTPSSTTGSNLPFDRLALEKARLERQKRLRGDVNTPASSSDDEDESQEPDGKDDREDGRDSKRRRLNGPQPSAVAGPSSSAGAQRDRATRPQSGMPPAAEMFLDGEVRPTWNQYAQDDRKRFKIQDVLGEVSRSSIVACRSCILIISTEGRFGFDHHGVILP